MSIAEPVNTWDIDPARRPSLNDMGGASLEDDADNPPDPEQDPTAASLNQMQSQCASLAKVALVCAIDITNDGATAAMARFTAPGNNVSSGTFATSRLSQGFVEILWPAGTFPTAVCSALAQMTSDHAWAQPCVTVVSNGVHVTTRDIGPGGAGFADGPFTLYLY